MTGTMTWVGLDVHARSTHAAVSWPGFDGDSERRAFCPPERRFSFDATSKEVPRGADRPRCAARAGVRAADRACRQGHRAAARDAEKRVRQVEADQGLRPDLPTSEERQEIKRLKRENYELRRANEILKAASVFF